MHLRTACAELPDQAVQDPFAISGGRTTVGVVQESVAVLSARMLSALGIFPV